MDSSSTYTGEQFKKQEAKAVAAEFASWPVTETANESVGKIRHGFDVLLADISSRTPAHNARYLALVKTKLEEACMFAVKGIAKPN